MTSGNRSRTSEEARTNWSGPLSCLLVADVFKVVQRHDIDVAVLAADE
ncbi:hypothetical protein ACFPFV_01775 [Salinicoccus siamensis]